MTVRRLVLLGPPGSGKSTQARRASGWLGVPHISTGQMLRRAAEAGTPVGRAAAPFVRRGTLVPDDVVVSLLAANLTDEGFVLDGFPRDVGQALSLEGIVPEGPDLTVHLALPEPEVVRRLGGRVACARGHTYHLEDRPPAVDGVCDVDAEPLAVREDDRPPAVLERLKTYRLETEAVLDHYRSRRLLVDVDGSGLPDDVTERILGVLRA